MKTKKEVTDAVREVCMAHLDLFGDRKVADWTHLVSEGEADSLDRVEIVMAIEEELMTTLDDALRCIDKDPTLVEFAEAVWQEYQKKEGGEK